jgi:hypothetical protein
MKMGRRLRCSAVTYRCRYAPSSRLAGGPFLIATKAMLFMGQDTRYSEKNAVALKARQNGVQGIKRWYRDQIVA